MTRLRGITLQEFKLKDTEVEQSRTLVANSNAKANQALAQLKATQAEYGQLRVAYNDTSAQASQLETQVTELRSEVAELPDLRQDIDSLEFQVDQLRSKRDELISAQREIDNLKAELAQRRSEANELTRAQQEIAKLKEEVSQLRAASPGDQLAYKRVKELEDENLELRNELAKVAETRVEQAELITGPNQEQGEPAAGTSNGCSPSVKDQQLAQQGRQIATFNEEREAWGRTLDANKQLLDSWRNKAQRSDYELEKLRAEHATCTHEYMTAPRSPVPSPVATGPVPSSVSLPPDKGGQPSHPVASSRPPDFPFSRTAQSLTSLEGPGLPSGQPGYVGNPYLPPRFHSSIITGAAGFSSGQPSYPDHRGGQPTQYSGPHQGGYTLPNNHGPMRARHLSSAELGKVARYIQRFTPSPQGATDTQTYLEEIDAHLAEYGPVATESKIKLIGFTASREVTNFIRRQADDVRGHWASIREAIIEEFTDHRNPAGLTAAGAVNQFKDEGVHAYYTRLRKAFFGECNTPDIEENLNFKTLFVANLQPFVRRQLPLSLEPSLVRASELKALARKAFERERPKPAGERHIFSLRLEGGHSRKTNPEKAPGNKASQQGRDGRDQYRRGDYTVPSWREKSASCEHNRPPSRDSRHRGSSRDRGQSPFRKIRFSDEGTDEPKSLWSGESSNRPVVRESNDSTGDKQRVSMDMDVGTKLIAAALRPQLTAKGNNPDQTGDQSKRKVHKGGTKPEPVLCLSMSSVVATEGNTDLSRPDSPPPMNNADSGAEIVPDTSPITHDTLSKVNTAGINPLAVGHNATGTGHTGPALAENHDKVLAIQPKLTETPGPKRVLARILQKGPYRELYIAVTLEQELVQEALLDTAADISLMSRSLFQSLQDHLHRDNREINLCYHPIRFLPYAKSGAKLDQAALCHIQVGPMAMVHPIYVSELDQVPLLVGRDLLLRLQPIIDLSEGGFTVSTTLRRPEPFRSTEFVESYSLATMTQEATAAPVSNPTQLVCLVARASARAPQTPPLITRGCDEGYRLFVSAISIFVFLMTVRLCVSLVTSFTGGSITHQHLETKWP